jgi:hypothetical protein
MTLIQHSTQISKILINPAGIEGKNDTIIHFFLSMSTPKRIFFVFFKYSIKMCFFQLSIDNIFIFY